MDTVNSLGFTNYLADAATAFADAGFDTAADDRSCLD